MKTTTKLLLCLAAAVLPALASAESTPSADYARYCVWCHGAQGTGRGPSAARLTPVPRDFRAAQFRCRTTPSGSLPTDDDLRTAIRRGMPGTAMPSWAALSDRQLADLLATLKAFSPAWGKKGPGTPIVVPPEPPGTAESVQRGHAVYDKMGCATCHGPSGHGDGPAASTLRDDQGNPIRPADFTVPGGLKCGDSPERVYTTFMTGLNGTPMPSFDGQLGPAEAWDLVHFVASLREQ